MELRLLWRTWNSRPVAGCGGSSLGGGAEDRLDGTGEISWKCHHPSMLLFHIEAKNQSQRLIRFPCGTSLLLKTTQYEFCSGDTFAKTRELQYRIQPIPTNQSVGLPSIYKSTQVIFVSESHDDYRRHTRKTRTACFFLFFVLFLLTKYTQEDIGYTKNK